jgi:HD-like signal output (HDOD) protein
MTNSQPPTLRQRLERLDQMPTLPVVLLPLLRYMEQPLDRLEMQPVVDLISQDKSLAAQCLHLANSPLFGHWQDVDNIRSAVTLLGMQQMRDLAVSCSVLKLLPRNSVSFDPAAFWEHSLACALVSRHFAQRIGFSDPRKAYLAGLLHDLGIVAHLWIEPQGFQAALRLAQERRVPLHQGEQITLGQTHCETGKTVAERWRLSADLTAVVSCHHDPPSAGAHRSLVALCRLAISCAA